MIISMSEQIKEKSFSGQTKVIVSRTFGDQNVLEVYNDDVDSGRGSLDYDLMIPIKNIFN